MIQVRNLLAAGRRGVIDIPRISKSLGIDDCHAAELLIELLGRGWIYFDEDERRYKRTREGARVAAAKAVPPLNRARAQIKLDGFISRVHVVNDDDDFGDFVDEVYVFGSFLDQSVDFLGDIDLAVSVHCRPIVGRSLIDYPRSRQVALGVTGWFSDFSYHEVMQYLKARDPYISIHGLARIQSLDTAMSLIYRAPDKVREEHAHSRRSKAE